MLPACLPAGGGRGALASERWGKWEWLWGNFPRTVPTATMLIICFLYPHPVAPGRILLQPQLPHKPTVLERQDTAATQWVLLREKAGGASPWQMGSPACTHWEDNLLPPFNKSSDSCYCCKAAPPHFPPQLPSPGPTLPALMAAAATFPSI